MKSGPALCEMRLYVVYNSITDWLSLQARTSETQQEQQTQRRSSNLGQQQLKENKQEQQTAKWDFRVMTYNILAEGLVRLITGPASHA